MSQVLTTLFHLPSSKWITIAILGVTCVFYTYALLHGMKGISLLAKSCMYLFFALLAYVLFLGGETRYILETGFAAVGNLAQNFLGLATFTDPQRTLPSRRTGRSSTGPTGWCGAWHLRSLSDPSPAEERCARRSSADMPAASALHS